MNLTMLSFYIYDKMLHRPDIIARNLLCL